MTTRRDLLRSLPVTGAAFAVSGGAMFDENVACRECTGAARQSFPREGQGDAFEAETGHVVIE
jgi:hypothetical protein